MSYGKKSTICCDLCKEDGVQVRFKDTLNGLVMLAMHQKAWHPGFVFHRIGER